SRRRHTRFSRDWSSDVCSSDLRGGLVEVAAARGAPGVRLASDPVRDALAAVRGAAPGHEAASRFTASRAATTMPSPSAASASVRVIGGAILMTLPYRPPLPTSSPPLAGRLHHRGGQR